MWSTTSGFALTLLHFWLLDFVVKTGSSGCEEHLVARRGVIQTPNFPGAFSVPIGCRWIIDASEIPSKNGSIIVYLTQLYVYTGLTFTEYAYYESETSNFGASLLKEITEANVFQFRWFKTYRPFLVIEFQLDRLEGHHVRVLDNLLDVYGFNITYEMTEDEANPNSCTAKDCSFSGNCYLDADFTSFSCTCFDNFSGANCAFGALCKKNQQDLVCRNGGSCRHVGAAAVRCHCATGYTGNVCEIPPTRSQDSECEGENCILQCPYPSENRKPCQCKESTKIYHDRSRYECRIKLSNVTSLRASLVVQHSTIESLLSRQENRCNLKAKQSPRKKKSLTRMTCEELQSIAFTHFTDRTKIWKQKKNRDVNPGSKITCGLLPTLRVLAARGCNSQRSFCILPLEGQTDSASHLQITLLEAYCRENGIEVIRVSKETLKSMMCPSATDLSCILVTYDEPYFLESPE